MAKTSFGGAQGRAGNAGSVKHGFPRVPHDVVEPKQLRRYLQSQRDGLNEWRWLFDGLSGLTGVQQQRLIQLLVELSTQQGVIQSQQATILQLQNDLVIAQTDLLAAQNATTLNQTDIQGNQSAIFQLQTDIQGNQSAILQLQTGYGVLLGRVNCLNTNAGGACS